ncbi:MAG: DUF2786 domain-containing protein [Granulosicoccus sp.]
MSPDSQRLEIEFLLKKLAQWQTQQSDFHDRILALMSFWLRPAMESLDMSASQLHRALDSRSEAHVLRMWLFEEVFGHQYKGTNLHERYIREIGRTDNGLSLRYMRRMAKSTTSLWRITDKPGPSRIIITPVCGAGPAQTIYDRELAAEVDTGEVLMTRLIDMPAGPVTGQAIFNLGPISGQTENLSAIHLQTILSGFVSMAVQPPDLADKTESESEQKQTKPASRGSGPSGRPHHQDSTEAEKTRGNDSRYDDPRNTSNTQEPPAAQSSADRERLLERVRKLFAMAQQSDASPHEAEIALRRCQSLMAKYGISEDDLHTSEFGSAEFTRGRTLPSHVKFLASAVASLHDVLFVSGEAGFAEFRGFDVDAKVARLTLDYLTDAVERSLASRKRAGDFPAGRSAAYDYRLGYATQVNDRVMEIVRERKLAEQKSTGSGTSLTVRKKEIVDRECGRDLTSTHFRSSRGARDSTAHAAGVDDGSRVSLDQQVGGSTPPPSLPKR